MKEFADFAVMLPQDECVSYSADQNNTRVSTENPQTSTMSGGKNATNERKVY